MLRILKILRNILFIFILFGVFTAFFDYTRMTNGSEPIFNISTYNEINHIENYRGLFYQASRRTKASDHETLTDSGDIKFIVLTKNINIPNNSIEKKFDFNMKINKKDVCSDNSLLYFADEKVKIYTYCLDDLSIVDNNTNKEEILLSYLKKDTTIVDDLIQNMYFTGLNHDGTVEVFKSDDDYSNEKFIMYKCNKPYIDDIYLVPNGTPIMDDFCTYKDDDFRFLSSIEEEKKDSEISDENKKEIFYEDEKYYYEFDEEKKDRIYVSSPAVRLTPEKKYTLMDVLNNKILTIDELKDKGLKFNVIEK